MKWKREVANHYDFCKGHTLDFIQNELVNYESSQRECGTGTSNVAATNKESVPVNKTNEEIKKKESAKVSKSEEERKNKTLPHKPHVLDVLRNHTTQFIENEKGHSHVMLEDERQRYGISLISEHYNLRSPDADKERRKAVKNWTNNEFKREDMTVTTTRTDYGGSSLKRYVTTCYMKPKTVPVWYTESLLLNLNSTKRVYKEKVYFKNRLEPHYWSELMVTDVNFHSKSTKALQGADPQPAIAVAH